MSDSYFPYHSSGQSPGKSRDMAGALTKFSVSLRASDDGQRACALTERARFIDRWRTILNAGAGSVTTVTALRTACMRCWPRCRRAICAGGGC